MMKAFKRLAVLAVLLGAAVACVLIARGQFNEPYLYVDLRATQWRNVFFLGGALLCFALAAVFAIYLMFNADGSLKQLPLPLAAFLAFMALGCFLFCSSVEGLPCTHTTEISAYSEQFSGDAFRSGERSFFPTRLTGTVSDYEYYEKGDALAETVTVRYRYTTLLNAEQRRLDELGVDTFTEDGVTCYTLQVGFYTWQARLDRDNARVTYCRFEHPQEIPAYMPVPQEPKPEEPRPAHSSEPTAPTGGTT